MAVNIKRYHALEALLEEYWGAPIEELLEGGIGGETDSGEEVEIPFLMVIEDIRATGIYGFAEKEENTIHYWIEPSVASDDDIVSFLGHELGHLAGEQSQDDIAEEKRAEMFASVAVESFNMLKTIKIY